MTDIAISLVALIGLPAAGKTSFCQEIQAVLDMPLQIIHICFDDFYETKAGFNYKQNREQIFDIIKYLVEYLKQNKSLPKEYAHMLPSNPVTNAKNYLFLCDDNNYYRSMRHKLQQISQNYALGYGQIYFEVNLEIALSRNALRPVSKRVPDDIIQKMYTKIEKPLENEEPHTFFYNANIVDKPEWSLIRAFILKTFENIPAKPLNIVKVSQKASKIHELDILLRKMMGEYISKSENNKQKLAQLLNSKRLQILEKQRLINNEQCINIEQISLDFQKYAELNKF